jgi:hypothetical protein
VASDTPHLKVVFFSEDPIDVSSTCAYVNVEDHDRLIDKATIVMDDAKGHLAEPIRIGAKVQIEMGWAKENTTVFEGYIRRVKASGAGEAKRGVTVVAFDPAFKANLLPKKAEEYKGKLSAILEKLIGGYTKWFDKGEIKPDPDFEYKEDRPLKRREQQTDWALIQELAVEHSCRAFVEINAEEGKPDKPAKPKFYFVAEKTLFKQDPLMKLHHCRGHTDIVKFDFEQIAGSASPIFNAVTVDDEKGDAKPAEPSREPAKPAAKTPVDPPPGLSDAEAKVWAGAISSSEQIEEADDEQIQQGFYSGIASDPDMAERLVRRDPTRSRGWLGKGIVGGTVKLRAKGKVAIEGIAPWVGGDWYLVRVNHVYKRAPGNDPQITYETRFVVTQ